MKKVHSFLGSFKDRYESLGLKRYRPAYIITAYSLVAVILILSAEHCYSDDTNVVKVRAKTNFESIRFEETTDADTVLQSDKEKEVTVEEKVTSYLELGTLDGMTALATEQIAKLQETEEQISLAMEEQEEIKTGKAREVAEEERLLAIAKAEEAARIEAEAKRKAEELKKKQEENSKSAVSLSASERNVLERIVQAEAGNQDAKGKMLVASVVLNRVKSFRFPNTVQGVVFQHSGSTYQFSPAKSGSVNRVKVTDSTKTAVSRVLNGEDYSQGALFFVARSAANRNSLTWFDRKLTRLFTHGAHTFYK